jgi:hypothetical protein
LRASSFIRLFKSLDYRWYSRPYELNIIGVRSPEMRAGKFDDRMFVIYQSALGKWIIHSFACTTDPGTYWLKSPMHEKGTAILLEGQYIDTYQIGFHKGKYKALVQRKEVDILRDMNRDNSLDFYSGKKYRGLFGINIHRALISGVTKFIDKFSAGCQVLSSAKDFYLLMELAEKHRSLYGNKFTYTLIDLRSWKRKKIMKALFWIGTVMSITTLSLLLFTNNNKIKTT